MSFKMLFVFGKWYFISGFGRTALVWIIKVELLFICKNKEYCGSHMQNWFFERNSKKFVPFLKTNLPPQNEFYSSCFS